MKTIEFQKGYRVEKRFDRYYLVHVPKEYTNDVAAGIAEQSWITSAIEVRSGTGIIDVSVSKAFTVSDQEITEALAEICDSVVFAGDELYKPVPDNKVQLERFNDHSSRAWGVIMKIRETIADRLGRQKSEIGWSDVADMAHITDLLEEVLRFAESRGK